MEQHNATKVESITQLTAGDTVTVTGNGMDVTAKVADISQSSPNDRLTAWLEPTDGCTWSLTDTTHPLQSDGIMSKNGAVTVTLHN